MGPSAAYKVEGLCDGVPAPSGVEGRRQGQLSLCSAPTMPFSSHASGAEEPTESKPWCVDHGDWLEAMSTVELWRALELGELPHSTRVWREGLECWTAAGEVKALGWTISQPPPPDEAPALSAADEGPESTGPLSFALTPDHLRSVAPRPHQGGRAGARDERAGSFLLAPFPPAEAAARRETPSPPISLEIPSCFPAVPSSPPDTLPSAGTARAGAAKPGSEPARGARDADQAPRGRASGTWSRLGRLARRARASRSAVSLAAGSAAIVLALGLSVLSALAPAGAPSAAAVAPAARLGVAQGVAAAGAQVVAPAPALAGAAGAAALPAAAPRPAPALAPTPALAKGAGAALAEGAGADPAEGAGADPAEGAGAPELRPQQAGKAPAAGAKPAPLGRRERGQVRLRRGRYEPDGARGIAHPGRGAGPSVGTGAILRDSR
ncbi:MULTISPECIES: DUF4339 domain-containing protein [Sorangium]|uniref:GYF domain-containing protein n=1 Tax=Sorangium cellulosum TaxID=56 RepID=A0A4P2R2E4_SORCE|nr:MULTISPECIES: DUF4339 domain-containing protein [Sorangium]AUX37140.1 hypothetical protein SOCE836_093610 [Sorangium cellulosum]WCQ96430.1 hypothetical protein NQZ70_09216 [Sorangium sp. Soce836]